VLLGPLIKILNTISRKMYYTVRIAKIVLLYYSCTHILACLWIFMAHSTSLDGDYSNTWLVRVGLDLSSKEIYIHSFYYMVNTFSQICIGDITSVNEEERMFNIGVIVVTLCLYGYLFGNVTSMIARYLPSYYVELNEAY